MIATTPLPPNLFQGCVWTLTDLLKAKRRSRCSTSHSIALQTQETGQQRRSHQHCPHHSSVANWVQDIQPGMCVFPTQGTPHRAYGKPLMPKVQCVLQEPCGSVSADMENGPRGEAKPGAHLHRVHPVRTSAAAQTYAIDVMLLESEEARGIYRKGPNYSSGSLAKPLHI